MQERKQKGSQKERIPIFLLFGLILFFAFTYFFTQNKARAANTPSIITYQGKLLIGNRLASTTQNMYFVLYDALTGGNVLYSASGTIASPNFIAVAPTSGLFSVNLGDTGTNSITPTIFRDNASVFLEVRIGSDTLSPRKRITASPYSFNSRYLDGVGSATNSTTTYIPVSDSNGGFIFNSTTVSSTLTVRGVSANNTVFQVISSTGTSLVTVRSNGNVGIGTTTPPQKLSVSGNISNIIDQNTVISLVTTTYMNGDNVSDIFVSGRYAYVVFTYSDIISIIDVSNPSAPIQIATTSVGDTPNGIFVSGRYAYVAYDTSNPSSISIIDISGTEVSSLIAHSAEVGNIQSRNDILAQGNIMAGTSLLVGAGGIMSNGALSVFASSTGSTSSIFSVDSAQTANILEVFANGNVGIGTTTPPAKLSVVGTVGNNNAFDVASSTGVSLLRITAAGDVLINTTTKFGANEYALYVDSGSGETGYGIGVVGRIQSSGIITSGTLDIAESYFIEPSCSASGNCPSAGDVVCITSGSSATVKKCENEYDAKAIGIISTNPGIFLGNAPEENTSTRMVALSGRVPVKISTANGNISIGDKLTSSNIPGVAVKAAEEGQTIGIALEDYSSSEVGTVLAFVDLGWSNKLYRGLTINTASNTISAGNQANPYNLILSNNLSFSNSSSLNTIAFATTTLLESMAGNYSGSKAFILNATNFSGTDSPDRHILSLRSNNTPVFSVSANGDLVTKGSIYGASLTLGTSTNPGDLAERVDIAIDDNVEPGDVMIVDQNSPDTYRRSEQAYEQSIAGIISTNPTIIVGNGKTDYTAVLAMVGRAPVKVTNENGNIQRGDLLVSASQTGYAMKYDPAKDDKNKMVAVIGVALEPLAEPTGKILSLIRTGWIYNRDRAIADIKTGIQQLAGNQGINLNQNNNPQNLIIEESPISGNLTFTNNVLDLQNGAIINVATITGAGGKWRIDGEGGGMVKVQTTEGEKEIYGLQSQSMEVVFSSSSQLMDGQVEIKFEPSVSDIINSEKPLKISVTLTSDSGNGIFVANKSATGFVVKELSGGRNNATFDWIVVANKKTAQAPQIQQTVPQTQTETSTQQGAVQPPASELPAETQTSTEEVVILIEPAAVFETSTNNAALTD